MLDLPTVFKYYISNWQKQDIRGWFSMVDKLIFTVTPIFSIPPRGAAAVETWMYQVAQRTRIPNRIICIKEDGFTTSSLINERCSIHRIGFSKIYKRLFQKWTR